MSCNQFELSRGEQTEGQVIHKQPGQAGIEELFVYRKRRGGCEHRVDLHPVGQLRRARPRSRDLPGRGDPSAVADQHPGADRRTHAGQAVGKPCDGSRRGRRVIEVLFLRRLP